MKKSSIREKRRVLQRVFQQNLYKAAGQQSGRNKTYLIMTSSRGHFPLYYLDKNTHLKDIFNA